MRRTTTLVMLAIVIVGTVAVVPMAATAQDEQTTTEADAEGTANATAVPPGAQLMGAIGVQQAEVSGEVETRAFGLSVARAASNDTKGEIIAKQAGNLERRLERLRAQKQELERARENGSISDGAYRARMAQLAARTETVKRLANASENESARLPERVRKQHGVDTAALQRLRTDAANMTGPEVARIARSIAGNDVGKAMSSGRMADADRGERGARAGSGRDGGNRTDAEPEAGIRNAAQTLERVREQVERADQQVAGGNGSEALQQATEQLRKAEQALEAARTAKNAGDEAKATQKANEALRHANQAREQARQALEAAGSGDGSVDVDQSGDGSTDSGSNKR